MMFCGIPLISPAVPPPVVEDGAFVVCVKLDKAPFFQMDNSVPLLSRNCFLPGKADLWPE